MPRTITVDSLQMTRMQLLKDANGDLQVYAEYTLKAGAQVVQAKQDQIQARLSGARKAAAQALFDAIAQDLTALEVS